jgi:hypothetical protein
MKKFDIFFIGLARRVPLLRGARGVSFSRWKDKRNAAGYSKLLSAFITHPSSPLKRGIAQLPRFEDHFQCFFTITFESNLIP